MTASSFATVATRLSAASAALTASAPESLPEDDPGPELFFGWMVVFIFFVGFLGWAAFARLDAAATAEGAITLAGHRQVIQHRDGGVLSAVHVHENQHVETGDVLFEIAPSEVAATALSLQGELISLQAERSRLQAEQAGKPTLTPPPEWAALGPEQRRLADASLARGQSALLAWERSGTAEKAVLQQKEEQLRAQSAGLSGQLASTERQTQLVGEELTATRGLAARGYATVSRVRELESEIASLSGSKADLSASVLKSEHQVFELHSQRAGADSERQEQVSHELQAVEQQIAELTPRLLPLRQAVDDATIRAPQSGTVVGLSVFSKGAVIAPGQRLMELVPDAAPLVVDARLAPNEVADLAVGQAVQVRIAALHDRSLPILVGKLTEVSADALQDERTGARYFQIEVTVPVAEVIRLRKAQGKSAGVRPGLPAQITVSLRKRTALDYLLEPLTQSMWTSLHEH